MAIKYTKGKKPTKKPARKAKATNKDGCQNAGKYKTKENVSVVQKGWRVSSQHVQPCKERRQAVRTRRQERWQGKSVCEESR